MSEEVEAIIEDTASEKLLNQGEVDKIVADRVGRERRKFEKKYDGVDVDQFRKWQEKEATAELDQATAKGEFEKVIKLQAEKNQAEIAILNKRITKNEVDGALLRAAQSGQSVDPDQVVQLLKGNVKLNSESVVEVVDAEGITRYSDDGIPLTVDDLVGGYLTTNPHLVKSSQFGGANSSGNVGGDTQKPKSVGEMSAAEYAIHRKKIGRDNSVFGHIQPK